MLWKMFGCSGDRDKSSPDIVQSTDSDLGITRDDSDTDKEASVFCLFFFTKMIRIHKEKHIVLFNMIKSDLQLITGT